MGGEESIIQDYEQVSKREQARAEQTMIKGGASLFVGPSGSSTVKWQEQEGTRHFLWPPSKCDLELPKIIILQKQKRLGNVLTLCIGLRTWHIQRRRKKKKGILPKKKKTFKIALKYCYFGSRKIASWHSACIASIEA